VQAGYRGFEGNPIPIQFVLQKYGSENFGFRETFPVLENNSAVHIV